MSKKEYFIFIFLISIVITFSCVILVEEIETKKRDKYELIVDGKTIIDTGCVNYQNSIFVKCNNGSYAASIFRKIKEWNDE